jgi:hypothetical protein
MLLLETLAGALPNHEVRPVGRPAKTKAPRWRWSLARIARLAGVHRNTAWRHCRADDELKRLLRVRPDRLILAQDLTEAEVMAACERILRLSRQWHAFSPRHGVDACLTCGGTESVHGGHGKCRRCNERERRIAKGRTVFPFPRAWDRLRGGVCCLVCHRNEYRHKCDGMCASCHRWWFDNDMRNKKPHEVVWLSARRRKNIQNGTPYADNKQCANGHWRRDHGYVRPDGMMACRACKAEHKLSKARIERLRAEGAPLCRNGHDLRGNTFVDGRGYVTCRTCRKKTVRMTKRRWTARQKRK